MALVGILTGIEVIKSAVTSNFSSMGANSFQITSEILKSTKRKQGGMEIARSEGKEITYSEAKAFKQHYPVPATVSISMAAGGTATVSIGAQKSNPNIRIMGVDNEYFSIASTDLIAGRVFSSYEQESGSYLCVLGHGIALTLFKKHPGAAMDKMISLDGIKLKVVGVAEEKGGSMFSSADNFIFLPLSTARALFGGNSFAINVAVPNVATKSIAADEAEGTFRPIRKLPLGTTSNFSISQNDSIAKMLLENIATVNWAAVFIGLITLFGSVIGLMNIMLVSVAERTREIGVSKALGAKSKTIKGQFLTESILISVLGGAVGVVLGVAVGNIVGLALHTPFVVPWLWMLSGISLCALVGILSGIYPAIKASRLDPIVALRYE
ncbi:MAG: ABC transporter permease [Bacteroidetes bacterium]|nr:ABC transporter permease [Bacteroidota bacterium]